MPDEDEIGMLIDLNLRQNQTPKSPSTDPENNANIVGHTPEPSRADGRLGNT